jgi:hypothetical protein
MTCSGIPEQLAPQQNNNKKATKSLCVALESRSINRPRIAAID